MHIHVVIPARGGSKGVPRKNLQPIQGVSLLARAIRTAAASTVARQIIVSTDDAEIAALARSEGAAVVVRPPEISGDTASSESALLHTLETLQLPHGDLLIFMQCTCPLTQPGDLRNLVDAFLEQEADSAFTATFFHGFIWKRDACGIAQAVNHNAAVRLRRQDKEPEFVENGALYAFRVGGFLQYRHRFFGRVILSEMSAARSLDVDSFADLEKAEAILKNGNI